MGKNDLRYRASASKTVETSVENTGSTKLDDKTKIWWVIICLASIANMTGWCIAMLTVNSQNPYVKWHLILSGIYTAVCAFRSFLPRIELERVCLVDTVFSSMVISRTGATVAEICFATQAGLFLEEISGLANISWVASLKFPTIIALSTAQVLCWYGVVTLDNMGHFLEESLWMITFFFITAATATCARHLEGPWQVIAWACTGLFAVFVCFMAIVDVPMYLRRWLRGDTRHMGLTDGFFDALRRRKVRGDWEFWGTEAPWLTGYFIGAVMLSQSFMHMPR